MGMAYPQINGAAINAWGINASSGAVEVPAVAEPLSPLINGAGVNSTLLNGGGLGASFQPPGEAETDLVAMPASLRPTTFGIPDMLLGAGPEAQTYPVPSLQPVLLGSPEVVFGQQPGDVLLPATSLRPVLLGAPQSKSALAVGPTQSLVPVHFGGARADSALAVTGLMPVAIGKPSLAVKLAATSLRAPGFGASVLLQVLTASGAVGVATLGKPGLRLEPMALYAGSLVPVRLGTPTLPVAAMRARAMCPTRLGSPSLDRGNAC